MALCCEEIKVKKIQAGYQEETAVHHTMVDVTILLQKRMFVNLYKSDHIVMYLNDHMGFWFVIVSIEL
jgi:hypothetical protein